MCYETYRDFIVMPTCQESQHAVTNNLEKEENNFTDDMLEHRTSYSIAMNENVLRKSKVFVPQSLLHNPITDPEYSERVKTYVQSKKEEDIDKIRTRQPIFVRKDLLWRSPAGQTQFINPLDDLSATKERLEALRQAAVPCSTSVLNSFELFTNYQQCKSDMMNIC